MALFHFSDGSGIFDTQLIAGSHHKIPLLLANGNRRERPKVLQDS
jgi:hypothetical protein